MINGYLGRTRGGKVSFTHIIGYAVVRAIADRHRASIQLTDAPGGGLRVRVEFPQAAKGAT